MLEPLADRDMVLAELNRILDSPFFCTSERSRQFLSYVVKHKLDGKEDFLKERAIGNELFNRKADYSTGDDAIVRVNAGDVRKRLHQYYQSPEIKPQVRIELPVGLYVPKFHVMSAPPVVRPKHTRRNLLWLGLVTVLAVFTGCFFVVRQLRVKAESAQSSAIREFWAPVLSSSQPLLIYMSKPVLYRPSDALYRAYSKTHPEAFTTEIERMSQPLPLSSTQRVLWGDMKIEPEFGVAEGDVFAAFRISTMLTNMGKLTQLHIGNSSSFEDLRNSPALIIGAFSNRWTLEMTSDLRYVFDDDNGQLLIEDRKEPKTRWLARSNQQGECVEDFAIINRLLSSKTGQTVVTVAGIRATGSDAAAQLISNPTYLANALRSAPADWRSKNMQLVIKTDVVDSVAGPPQVVAKYFW